MQRMSPRVGVCCCGTHLMMNYIGSERCTCGGAFKKETKCSAVVEGTQLSLRAVYLFVFSRFPLHTSQSTRTQ